MPFFTQGDPANADLGPQPMVHHATCRDLMSGERDRVLLPAKPDHPYAVTCPHCFDGTGLSQGPVVYEQVDYPAHEYNPAMAWPGGIKRELCRICHGTHAEELAAIGFHRAN